MANYIKTLQDTVAEKEQEIKRLEEMIQDLAVYLALPKFDNDTTVSKYDILRMIGRY